MTATLVTGIGELVTFDPAHPGPLGIVNDAAVLSVEGRVVWTGAASAAPRSDADEVIEVAGAAVIPGRAAYGRRLRRRGPRRTRNCGAGWLDWSASSTPRARRRSRSRAATA